MEHPASRDSAKRLRDGENWHSAEVESLDKFFVCLRERLLSEKQRGVNPLEIILEYVSTNRHALNAKFFACWSGSSPNCSLDSFESIPRTVTYDLGSASGQRFPADAPSITDRVHESNQPRSPPDEHSTVWEYPSGSTEDYRLGLAKRIGYPYVADFEEGMRIEHCNKVGWNYAFGPRNQEEWAGSKTTPKDEWYMVLHGTNADGQEPPSSQMTRGRRRISLTELWQLPIRTRAGLRRPEIIGLALYTGPMYAIYNCILQQKGEHWDTFQHNHFPTTLSVIVSAIQKLGSVTPLNPGQKLYRGNGGREYLPDRFFVRDGMNVKGMTAYGFQSFTASLDLAIKYAKPDGAWPVVFVVEPSSDPLSGFADISDFSQFPEERERLLPPCSFLHPDVLNCHSEETLKHGTIRFIPTRVTASQSPSLEDLETKKKKMHIAEFENRVIELREHLEKTARKHNAELRLQSHSEQTQNCNGKKRSISSFLDSIVAKVNDVLTRHSLTPPSEFNTKRYSVFVQESLDCVRMAPSLLKLWLRDDTEYIHNVQGYSLLAGHRWFVSFLRREYHDKPCDRPLIARKLCKHLALISDSNEQIYGETPLMNAAAFGRSDETLEFLVSAGQIVHETNSVTKKGECALHLAADNGHVHCIRSLIRLGANIDQAYTVSGQTALHRACINSYSHCVAALACLKADVNKTCAANHRTPLAEAAERGFELCVEELARYGANIDKSDKKLMTPLFTACNYGKASCVASLLKLGAQPNLGPNVFDSPLRIASKRGNAGCIQEFRRVSNDSLFSSHVNPLIVAIANTNFSCVYALLDLKPPLQFLASALFAAIWFNHLEIVRVLLTASIAGDLKLLQSKDEDGLDSEQFAWLCSCDEQITALLSSVGGKHVGLPTANGCAQHPIHWKNLTGPRSALCVTCCDTLRFYSPVTAIAVYGCRVGSCAYYEVTIRHPGLVPQFGLCSAQFIQHFRQQRDASVSLRRIPSYAVQGVGDIVDSWAVDGVRHLKWDGTERNVDWNVHWQQGDVVGVACNMVTRQMFVSLNGDYSDPNGKVFDLSPTAVVIFPALFTSTDGHLRTNLGHSPFRYAPPSEGYFAFAEMVSLFDDI